MCKTPIKIFILFLFFNFGTGIVQKVNAQNVSVSFQVFYDDLSPYGTWINSPAYGYVWIPNEEAGFSPYATNGYWTYTEYGWTWVSYYSWGWAPFHYGRWYSDPMYGPCWVPDNEWGPGWVSWRYSDGYYGWGCMGPGSYQPRDEDWIFVDVDHFGNSNSNNYYGPRGKNSDHIKNSTIINNSHTDNSSHVTYNSGPNKEEVEKYNGKKITTVLVKESNAHTQSLKNDQMEIYKPQVEKNNVSVVKYAPKKVSEIKDVKPVQQNKTQNINQPIEQPKQQPQQQKENKPVVQSQQPKQQPQQQPQQQLPKQQPQQQQPKQQPQQQQPKQQPQQQQPKQQPQQQQPKQQPQQQQPKQQPQQQHQRSPSHKPK